MLAQPHHRFPQLISLGRKSPPTRKNYLERIPLKTSIPAYLQIPNYFIKAGQGQGQVWCSTCIISAQNCQTEGSTQMTGCFSALPGSANLIFIQWFLPDVWPHGISCVVSASDRHINYSVPKSPLGLEWPSQKDSLKGWQQKTLWQLHPLCEAEQCSHSFNMWEVMRQKRQEEKVTVWPAFLKAREEILWLDVAPRPCFQLTTLKTFLSPMRLSVPCFYLPGVWVLQGPKQFRIKYDDS